MAEADTLYEQDYAAWAEAQAAELRRMLQSRINSPLDLENLAEEVEDLSRSAKRAARSEVKRILLHLLKLQYSDHEAPRGGWRRSVISARQTLEDDLTPTLRRDLELRFDRLYANARTLAVDALAEHGEPPEMPAVSPYTLDQVLDSTWWPEAP